jgi:rare lipoprotein A
MARLAILLVAVSAAAGSGCGGRRPVSASPPPTQPAPAPEETAEAARRSTEVPEAAEPRPKPASSRPAKPRASGTAPDVAFMEEGNASWYGNPFHGRRSSNGEVYDMNKLTAAHRTLPFDTLVRVTNLNNGKSTVVRITDRGPFVANRIIDLSQAAAREIESIGPGVVPVRIEVLSSGIDPESGYFTVQIGAFRDRSNAERLRDRLSATYSPIFIVQYDTSDGPFYRVRVGKAAGESAVRELSQKLHDSEGFATLIFRLDDDEAAKGRTP